jgi:fluoroquinolone transport system permease protein
MQITKLLYNLGSNDVKLIRRDSFLIFMFLFAAIIAAVLHYGLPWLNVYLAETGLLPMEGIATSLAELYPMLVAFFALFDGALLVGAVFGFVLLDERDGNTIKAMLVTPVPLKYYLVYRVAVPFFLGFFVIAGMVLFIDLALLPLWQMLLLIAGASLTASIVALFFATFAGNKVEGFALSKVGGIAGWSILLGWFLPEPWGWLMGLFPPYWISKAYWMAYAGESLWWVVLIIGIILQLVLVIVLIKRFNKTAYR